MSRRRVLTCYRGALLFRSDYSALGSNGTDGCSNLWRASYIVSACSKSQSADQLVFHLRHHPINGRTILSHFKSEFDAIKPKTDHEVVSYEVLQVGTWLKLARCQEAGSNMHARLSSRAMLGAVPVACPMPLTSWCLRRSRRRESTPA